MFCREIDELSGGLKDIMKEITLEELLAAGAHFGHQVIRANPKARDFVFEARDNIQIIDLAKTKQGLEEAAEFLRGIARQGGTLLIIGTKRQAKEIVLKGFEKVKDKNVLYVTSHWVGGILTNFSEVSKNLRKLSDLKTKLASEEEKAKYTKKEVGLWEKERQRLESLYGGIANMTKLPDAVYIIDSHLESLAVKEARMMGVPIAAIVDTNADPNLIDYPIPANDDAVGSIEIITSYLIDNWNESFRIPKPDEKLEEADRSPDEGALRSPRQLESSSNASTPAKLGARSAKASSGKKLSRAKAPRAENSKKNSKTKSKKKK